MYRVATVNVRNTAIMAYGILRLTHIDMGLPVYLTVCRFTCERLTLSMLDCVWNVIAHAQKPDFVFRRNGRVHLNRRGASVQSTMAADLCASAVVDFSWNVMAHGDAREGKSRGNWRMELVASNLHTASDTWCIQHNYRWCAHLGCQ